MQFIRKPFQIIRANLRAYLLLNAVAYGLFLDGFAIGLVFPDLAAARAETLENDGTGDLVLSLVGNPRLFALVILAVNTLQLSALTILLPIVIELQAYILLLLGVFLLGKFWLRPQTIGAPRVPAAAVAALAAVAPVSVSRIGA
ncbi:hypothetical protein [Compostimonas suwonensis]|uniref:Uncharacterized protein n=1 Tax=Compostimonas suwonensis TaxID=1048394 RepID=A0A2M9BBB4_9MICO|nr:hypothetical protein [Compostimonas suwonensis]PJJ55235.1 hypothetical protein CLV54_3372 [Compostimonas suwonensis]